jgi:tetratricopeptide (TPR) repeat protein
MHKRNKMIAGAVAFGISFTTALVSAPPDRFDHKVRNDFFSGFAGNREAFTRAMNVAAETIAANPNHAEALVWHGAGLYFQAGMAFQSGNSEKGLELYRKGMGEMDKGVALAPDHIGVRIPRGASLLAATSMQPMDDRVRGEVKRAVDDYQRAYDLQKDQLDSLGEHPLGQLLLGLGDGYSRLGDNAKANEYLSMIEIKIPRSAWATRAAAWKANGKLTVAEQQCIGCHVPKAAN